MQSKCIRNTQSYHFNSLLHKICLCERVNAPISISVEKDQVRKKFYGVPKKATFPLIGSCNTPQYVKVNYFIIRRKALFLGSPRPIPQNQVSETEFPSSSREPPPPPRSVIPLGMPKETPHLGSSKHFTDSRRQL